MGKPKMPTPEEMVDKGVTFSNVVETRKEKNETVTRKKQTNPFSNIDSSVIGKFGIFMLIVGLFVNAITSYSLAIVIGVFGIYLAIVQDKNKKYWLNSTVIILGLIGLIITILFSV